jgi:hypothetical protein
MTHGCHEQQTGYEYAVKYVLQRRLNKMTHLLHVTCVGHETSMSTRRGENSPRGENPWAHRACSSINACHCLELCLFVPPQVVCPFGGWTRFSPRSANFVNFS